MWAGIDDGAAEAAAARERALVDEANRELAEQVGSGNEYFAVGKQQDFQCTIRLCSGYTREEIRAKKGRILPCFVNGPLCRSRTFSAFGTQWRCCSRLGNFTVVLERLFQRDEKDPQREPWLIVGPYWPFCLALTTSLMVLVPVVIVVVFWSVLPWYCKGPFLGLQLVALAALVSVGCRNPGLVPHLSNEPEESVNGDRKHKWVFNDLTGGWRPRGAQYDRDVNAVVQDFDHVCPFTGTAIGGGNLKCFYCFVGMVQALIWVSVGVGCWALVLAAQNGYTPPGGDGDV